MMYRFLKFTIAFSCASNAFAAYDKNWVDQCKKVVRISQSEKTSYYASDSSRALFVWLGRYNSRNHGLKRLFYHSFYNPDIRFFHDLTGELDCPKLAKKLNDKKIDLSEIKSFQISDVMDHSSLKRLVTLTGKNKKSSERNYLGAIIGGNYIDKGYSLSKSRFDLNLLSFFFPGIETLNIDHEIFNESALSKMKNLKNIYFKDAPHQKVDRKQALAVLKQTNNAAHLQRISFDSVADHRLDYGAVGSWLSMSTKRMITFPLIKKNESSRITEKNITEFLKSISLYSESSLRDYEGLLRHPNFSEKSHMAINMKKFIKYTNTTRLKSIREE